MKRAIIEDEFDFLSGYEKGVVARALLQCLIKRGRLEGHPDDFEIVVPVNQQLLALLARFSVDDLHKHNPAKPERR